MPNNATVNFNIGTLPQSFNPGGDWQVVLNEFFKVVTAYLPGSYSLFNYGNTTPSSENQSKPWIRTNVDGSPDRTYIFFNGKWVARHEAAPSGSERRIWVGTLDALRSHDGGDGTTDIPTATTGAMWEEDTTWRDKIPMGILTATGQVQTPLATAGALSTSLTLTAAHLPRHRHEITIESASVGEAEGVGDYNDPDSTGRLKADSGSNTQWASSENGDLVGFTRQYGKAAPDAIAISALPPVIGIYAIKRTARVFITV